MNARSLRRWGLAALVAALAGAGWAVFGSAASLTVAPKNHSAFRTCVLTAYPTTTAVMFDSWVNQASPTTKNGTGTTVQVESRNSNRNTRAFLRFDLAKCSPTIDATATVKQATLRLTLSQAPTASRIYNLHAVVGPCPESATTCWTEANITWNNQPPVAANPTSTLTLSSSSSTNQYYAFDATADVAAIVAGTATNNGWRISDSVESSATDYKIQFKSRNAGTNAAGAPQLVILYSP